MTNEQFDALIDLIDSRITLASEMRSNPTDRSRIQARTDDAHAAADIARACLVGEPEGWED